MRLCGSDAPLRGWHRAAPLLLVAALAASAQTIPTSDANLLAVLELKNKLGRRKQVDATYLTDAVRAAALLAADLRVITRENLLVLLAAAGKKDLAECEGECEVETARNVGADFVITGEVLKIGSRFKLVLRLHETRLGSLLRASQASGRTIDELDGRIHAAVLELLAPFRRPVVENTPPAPLGGAPAPAEIERLEGEAVGNLKHLFTAEKNLFAEKDRYSDDLKIVGFEPEAFCEDGARNGIPEPSEKNRARGCHFIYEVRRLASSYLLLAHGAAGMARGMEFELDLEGPQQGIPRRVDGRGR